MVILEYLTPLVQLTARGTEPRVYKGAYGKVLVVQSTENTDQWKANDDGGVIIFEFASPVDQVLELGLLNVVADVMVQVTDNTQTISSFLVEKDHIGSYKTLILDIDQVLQVVVTLNGPTAVTHMRVCSDSMPVATVPSKTPTEICALGPQEISPSSSEPFYAQSPVSVVSSDGSSVKFTVSQQWTQDCSVAWTATKYASQEGVVRCDTQTDVIPEESFTYETVCEGNVALIEVYVMSPTFGDVGYISSLPESCGELSGDPANMISHVFKIPCDCRRNFGAGTFSSAGWPRQFV